MDATHLYFGERGDSLSANTGTGRVSRVAKGGGAVVLLAGGLAGPNGVDVDAVHVYWANFSGTIERAPIAGGVPEVVHQGSNSSQLSELRLVGDRVFFGDVGLGRVVWISKTEDEGAVVADDLRTPTRLVSNGNELLITDGGNFGGMDGRLLAWRDGGEVEVLVSDLATPDGVAVEGNAIFFSTNADGTIWRLERPAAPEPFVTGEPAPFALATDGVYLYATNRVVDDAQDCLPSGSLVAIPLGGGERVELANGLLCPSTIVVDADGIYWVNNGNQTPVSGGSVMKVAKVR